MLKSFRQEAFQGNIFRKRYFEGWYFKHVSHDLNSVFAFIPGVSISDADSHSFIQIIDGLTGMSYYNKYTLTKFFGDRERLYIKIDRSYFTCEGMHIDIKSDLINVSGDIYYSNMIKYPKSLISPGIMGWYSYIPFMECKHGVISISHNLKGCITINDNIIDFDKGRGYIEKDWGTSFPREWIWVHSNTFENSDASLMISIASIPWLKKYFIGFTAYLFYEGKLINFSSYNKSRISKIERNNNEIYIKLENSKFVFETNIYINNYGKLAAPVMGEMNRNINESISSELNLKLYDINNNLIFKDYGKRAGLEITKGILDCFISNFDKPGV